ncbi:sulfatase family protein [Marinifilum flexuosum]|uniref:sulfatase family protein n=1 Tax=Marinifilum flexuosum TaxID=1117708 RepID=UPI0024920B3A|nr:sulfatase-like hydrolase/transferase [Marinifilum flexuosum]
MEDLFFTKKACLFSRPAKHIGLAMLPICLMAGGKSMANSIGEESKAIKENNVGAKPNIVFFIADDIERFELNCLPEGKGKNLTPNLDRLAKEGTVMFGQHVSSAVCSPSRFSCLTGQYASRARNKKFLEDTKKMDGETVVQWNSMIGPESNSIARLLKGLGYTTGFFGKNHVVDVEGWKRLPLSTDVESPDAIRVLKQNGQLISDAAKACGFEYAGGNFNVDPSHLGPEKLRSHNLDWITEKSLDFIDKTNDTPFFLYYASTVPHSPTHADQAWNADRRVTPEGMLDKAPEVMPAKETIAQRLIDSGLATPGNISDDKANLLWLDDALGALMQKLEKEGKLDNTIIFFFGDHGQYAKGSIYEGGVSSPSIVWKKGGFKCGNKNEALVSNVDFAPTIYDMAGGDCKTVKSFDGKSFLPILNGEKKKIHESLYFEMGFSRGVLKDNYKFIALRYPEYAMKWDLETRQKKLDAWNKIRKENKHPYHFTDGSLPFSHLMLLPGGGDAEFRSTKRYKHYFDTDQLYDLGSDPKEQNNLFEDKAYAGKLKDLKEELKKYLDSLPGNFGEYKSK